MAGLSDEDLMEHTRYYRWWYRHEPGPFQRWNVAQLFSAARDELLARGYAHHAWMDGTEGAKT